MRRLLASALAAGLLLTTPASAAAPKPVDGDFAGVTSEGNGMALAVTGDGRIVTGFRFTTPCSDDAVNGVSAPSAMRIETTFRPKRKKGAKKRPKPRPLPEPRFALTSAGFTVRGKFTTPAHAEGTVRWVSPAGCDSGTVGFSADVVVQPS